MVKEMVPLSDDVWIQSARQRFEKRIIPVPFAGCWLWSGPFIGNGYGKFTIGKRQILAHRYSCALNVGSPDGFEIDHLCFVRDCVNPAHLEAVTRAENISRQSRHGHGPLNQTECPSGHSYSGDNLYITPKGYKTCRICRNAANRKYKAKVP